MSLTLGFFSLTTVLIIIISKIIFDHLYYLEEFHPTTKDGNKKYNRNKPGKNILLVNSCFGVIGGSVTYTINLYKELIRKEHNPILLITKNSQLEKKLKKLDIPHFIYNKFPIKIGFQPGLKNAIYKIYKKKNISIVHCNVKNETLSAIKIAKSNKLKVILTQHNNNGLKQKYLKILTSIIAVTPHISTFIKKNSTKIKNVEFIPPYLGTEHLNTFQNFTTNQSKQFFFKEQFNINLNNYLSIAMIANMPYNDNKNHILLLEAIKILVHEKNRKINLILAGDGPLKKRLKKLAQDFQITQYVHFLGFTSKIPEILYYSDIKILPSKNEAFGLSLIEAALLKKPLIGSSATGIENIIKHNNTGLLFKNNDLTSLVKQIEKLLENKELRIELGQNAYTHILHNLHPEQNLAKTLQFYKKVLAT